MSDDQPATELAQIEHELEVLRSRYAIMERWGRILKAFFLVFLPLAASGIVIYALMDDVVVGLFIIGIVLAVAAIIWLSRDDTKNPSGLPVRWIDMASPNGPWNNYFLYRAARFPSEARAIEEMIAARETLLAELKKIAG
ncbi:MAG: hypothetical protein QOD40_1518 [Alphaproteobacteria bacterium]|jgi:hypothetical protein|nr:hypothetical protein [Alphaproteobacteria bacterium]